MTRWLAVGLLWGCSGKDDSGDTGVADEPVADMKMADENNYAFTSSLTIGAIEVMPNSDLTIDWSALTTDIRTRSVNAADIDAVLLVEFELTQDGIMQKVEENDLRQEDSVTQWLYYNSSMTSALASEFAIIGNPFLPETALSVNADRTWLLSVVNLPDDGGPFDILMSTFIVPTTGSTNTAVSVTNTSSTLTFDADLSTLTPLHTASDLGPWSLDWSAVKKDSYGRDFDASLGTRLTIGHVDAASVADVEPIFARLFEEADQLYYQTVTSQTSADLSLSTDADGGAFPGFTTGGVWIAAIECRRTECTNPAPLLLSVIQVD